MTGRNPWVVLCVAEDAPYHEVQRAFRRRVKQTHPDGGGDALEFARVVEAFDAVRQTLPVQDRRWPIRPTPYDRWLGPSRPMETWKDDDRRGSARCHPPLDDKTAADAQPEDDDFTTILHREMSRV